VSSSLLVRSVSAFRISVAFFNDDLNISFQYWYEQKQPQRKNFISRDLSYHGNTVTTLSLSGHPARRKPYDEILQHENFHRVSPAYAKRFRYPEETEEQYVERLRQELEDKFLELGPHTVIGCKSSPSFTGNG
jgi:E3 ubiquitin-protein ligase TRIP12